MKQKIKSIFTKTGVLLLVGTILMSSQVEAKKAKYKQTKYEINYSEMNSPLKVENDKVKFYQYEEVMDGEALNTKHHFKIERFELENTGFKNFSLNSQYNDDYIRYAETIENSENTIVVSTIKKGILRFTTYNSKGETVLSIEDVLNKKKYVALTIGDIIFKDKKIYYTYITDSGKIHIRCMKEKDGKLVKDVKLKSAAQNDNSIIYNNQVYVIANNAVEVYALNGQKKGVYKLPKIKRTVKVGKEKVSLRENISICDNYIYYSNGTNGIYRCKINEANKGFSMFYDAKNDSNFKKSAFYDFCVKDKNTFYVRFGKPNAGETVKICDEPDFVICYNR